MRWWRKWLNRWHARAFVRFASLTESSQLTPCQTGTMRQTLSPTLSAPQWLALKTLFDLRYTDQFTVLDVCKHLSNLSKKPHIPFNVWASVIIRSLKMLYRHNYNIDICSDLLIIIPIRSQKPQEVPTSSITVRMVTGDNITLHVPLLPNVASSILAMTSCV